MNGAQPYQDKAATDELLRQRRRRVFVVGYLGDWRRVAAVLFERESLRGNPAPSCKAGQEFARGFECDPQFDGFTDLALTLDAGCKDVPVRKHQLGAGVMTYGIADNWIGRSPDERYIIVNVERDRLSAGGVERLIKATTEQDGRMCPVAVFIKSMLATLMGKWADFLHSLVSSMFIIPGMAEAALVFVIGLLRPEPSSKALITQPTMPVIAFKSSTSF